MLFETQLVMAYIAMAYTVVAYLAMAYIALAYIVRRRGVIRAEHFHVLTYGYG